MTRTRGRAGATGAHCARADACTCKGVGEVNVKCDRVLAGEVRTVTAKRGAGRWFVCFSVQVFEPHPLPVSHAGIGIDVGLTTFLVLSDGSGIANPRHFRAAERHLRRAQRKLARRQERSRRRQKARAEQARVHQHVGHHRRKFPPPHGARLGEAQRTIAVEDLNLKGLARSL